MARKKDRHGRLKVGDPLLGSRMAQAVINKIMQDGKKVTAERIFYGALQMVGERTKRNPVEVFAQAIRNVTPQVEVRPRRVGGATYQVPVEVSAKRQQTLGVRWLIRAARERGERTMVERLAAEISEAANREGAAMKRRDDMHRMADANKAYSHYRW